MNTEHRHGCYKPRLIIHGGAGNLRPSNLSPEQRVEFGRSLYEIISKTNTFMNTPRPDPETRSYLLASTGKSKSLPSSLETATYAVALLEDNALFNAGHGAVFTRDGVNELEASVMVSRGRAKRGIGVSGLRRVRNPVLLARTALERGDEDILVSYGARDDDPDTAAARERERDGLNVPSAQQHSLIFGAAAEQLAHKYGLELVEPGYFFTQLRWDQNLRGLQREKQGSGPASWSEDEYVPQGTVGAVALDEDGVVCCATSTGGLTNKLTGRVGDTPMAGAGFWAEEWEETLRQDGSGAAAVGLGGALRGLLGDCLGVPSSVLVRTRSAAFSCTGNGDSFIRINAARTVAAMARFVPLAVQEAVTRIAGPEGELQRSAGSRWGRAAEGEGGIIGIAVETIRDAQGRVVETHSRIVGDFNCGGMWRAWVDWDGTVRLRVWRHDEDIDALRSGAVML